MTTSYNLVNIDSYRELTFEVLEKREINLEATGGYKMLYKYASDLCYHKCKFLIKADPSIDEEDIIMEMLKTGIVAFYKAYRDKLYGYKKSINYSKRSLINSCNQIINTRTTQKKTRYIIGDDSYRHSTISMDKLLSGDGDSTQSLHNLLPTHLDTETEATQNQIFKLLQNNLTDKEKEFLAAFIEGPDFHKSKQNITNYRKYFNSIAKSFKLNPAHLRRKMAALVFNSEDRALQSLN